MGKEPEETVEIKLPLDTVIRICKLMVPGKRSIAKVIDSLLADRETTVPMYEGADVEDEKAEKSRIAEEEAAEAEAERRRQMPR